MIKLLSRFPTLLRLLALTACGQSSAGPPGSSAAYDHLLGTLYKNTVPTVRPAALAAELGQPANVLMLDTRTPAEYRVSHLAGARFVDFSDYQTEKFAGISRAQPVVVYCSVGYRSERVGERLRQLGFTNVRNLYGGLFEWVNEGYPVVNAQGFTTKVHPYSALWSTWLRRGKKAYD